MPEKPLPVRDANMSQKPPEPSDDLRPEYDFATAQRGLHCGGFEQGTNVVLLDGDVAEVFKDSESVNEALRLLIRLAREQSHIPRSA